jgi:hypothetical protein
VNQWVNASQERTTSSNLTDLGWVAARTSTPYVGGTPMSINVVGQEATVKDCGVTVAKQQGHSWTPHLTNGGK